MSNKHATTIHIRLYKPILLSWFTKKYTGAKASAVEWNSIAQVTQIMKPTGLFRYTYVSENTKILSAIPCFIAENPNMNGENK